MGRELFVVIRPAGVKDALFLAEDRASAVRQLERGFGDRRPSRHSRDRIGMFLEGTLEELIYVEGEPTEVAPNFIWPPFLGSIRPLRTD